MTRFTTIESNPTYCTAGYLAIILGGIALAHTAFQVALASGVPPLPSHAIGGVVAFLGGLVLAEYEIAVGFGGR